MTKKEIITIPFTYLIGWSKHNRYYYGVKTAKGCHPDDLWTRYFTSSIHVKKFRIENGEPDIIQVRKTFNNPNEAKNYEHKLLRRLKVVYSEQWLNKSYSNGKFHCTAHTQETRAIMSGCVTCYNLENNCYMRVSKDYYYEFLNIKHISVLARKKFERSLIFNILKIKRIRKSNNIICYDFLIQKYVKVTRNLQKQLPLRYNILKISNIIYTKNKLLHTTEYIEKLRNTVVCYDILLGLNARIPITEFRENKTVRYLSFSSHEYRIMTNTQVSQKTKLQLSISRKGRVHTEETKLLISKGNKNKIVSDETRNLLKNINLGKKYTEETKLKHKNRIVCYEIETNTMIKIAIDVYHQFKNVKYLSPSSKEYTTKYKGVVYNQIY